MSEQHNEAYDAVEDQRFWGDKLHTDISRGAGEMIHGKAKRPIEEGLKIIARHSKVTVELLRGTDRRPHISTMLSRLSARENDRL